MTTLRSTTDGPAVRRGRGRVPIQVGLSLLAAAVFAVRAVRSAVGDSEQPLLVAGVLLASLAAVLALGAALLARCPPWQAAVLLGGALLLELLILDRAAPPQGLAAVPLLFALALAVAPARPRAVSSATRAPRRAATVVTVVLMVPVGWFYLTAGLVVPFPWLLSVYLLFAVQLLAVVRLASRGSWWVLVTPFVAAAVLFAAVWAGTSFLGWSP